MMRIRMWMMVAIVLAWWTMETMVDAQKKKVDVAIVFERRDTPLNCGVLKWLMEAFRSDKFHYDTCLGVFVMAHADNTVEPFSDKFEANSDGIIEAVRLAIRDKQQDFDDKMFEKARITIRSEGSNRPDAMDIIIVLIMTRNLKMYRDGWEKWTADTKIDAIVLAEGNCAAYMVRKTAKLEKLEFFDRNEFNTGESIRDLITPIVEQCYAPRHRVEHQCYFDSRQPPQCRMNVTLTPETCVSNTEIGDCNKKVGECQRLCDSAGQNVDNNDPLYVNCPGWVKRTAPVRTTTKTSKLTGISGKPSRASGKPPPTSSTIEANSQTTINGEKSIITPDQCFFDDDRSCKMRNSDTFEMEPCKVDECTKMCAADQWKDECRGGPCGQTGFRLHRSKKGIDGWKMYANCPVVNETCRMPECKSEGEGETMEAWQIALIGLGSLTVLAIFVLIVVCLVIKKRKNRSRQKGNRGRNDGHGRVHEDRGRHGEDRRQNCSWRRGGGRRGESKKNRRGERGAPLVDRRREEESNRRADPSMTSTQGASTLSRTHPPSLPPTPPRNRSRSRSGRNRRR